ncbi:MAG: B12-binding domain-containing radical SAM protein [Candidatus Acididesulfobacter diazotrophicus]|uniref:B12-binding domain-containing radical SAM protein n=1 Tax=Candidatus Acididesulfobacter diazotrophicus TaxID=2597226 RepID=A0A519BQ32_9DELT|nr:MAG: B12-binding domain-containing radical SAM protein [Candidatus Acididesulfobacter diazotrophicus]
MKISISYPPLESEKGIALLSQNRQFQWFKDPTYIYPVVPAYAATLLSKSGFDVFWDDGIAEGLLYNDWLDRIIKEKPNVIAIETKTPVVKRHWKIINDIKENFKKTYDGKFEPAVVLMGDHVTALPEESLLNSDADFIMTGGDYDFSLLGLCKSLDNANKPELSSNQKVNLPKGIYYRLNNEIKNTGKANIEENDLNLLPFIDRNLTNWKLYAYKNGNFKFTPGTYMMTGRDCWWGKCKFCSWTTLYPAKTFRTLSVKRYLDEIGYLINDLKIKEIFDDSGCFPKGKWLKEFALGYIERGYNKKAVMGCNMRVGALNNEEWNLLKKANFRFVLIGLESMTQSTLDRLDKGIKIEQIEETVKSAKKAGLQPHITTMVGYPWETKDDAVKTIEFAKYLFKKGYIDTLQATIVVPYPGTPMFEEAKKNDWLLTEDWDRYDMKESVWKSPISNDDVLKFTQSLYTSALNPAFVIRKVFSIRNISDIKFLFKAGKKLMAHFTDFKG